MHIFDTKEGHTILVVAKGSKILYPGYFDSPPEIGKIIEAMPCFDVLLLKPQDEVTEYIKDKSYDCVVVITPPNDKPTYLYNKK
ncbi:MAG TPA: hypothetical protein VMX17_16230 [Candidatus Glassbacteria bacterium]|nr:hypothetical protein [Candidatus Glassbacteria bacterium]